MSREKVEARKAKKAKKKALESEGFDKKPIWLVLALILTLIAYANIYDNSYLNYDDDVYVTENPPLRGLDVSTLFGETYLNQYSPLAMTLEGIWFKVSDANPKFIRFMSVLVHLVNVLLVFVIFRLLFRDDFWAGMLALLFGVHPMQVESVAWLSAAMKIGTFAMFFLLAIWAYIRYRQSEDKKFLILTYIAFLASCLCKEQAVVLPVVLIAIDYLRGAQFFDMKAWIAKAPMFLISVIFGVLTLRATRGEEIGQRIYEFDLPERILFAFYSTGAYVLKAIVPAELSFFYTYPVKGELPVWIYIVPLIVIALIYVAVRAYKKEQRWLFFGIVFFLTTVFLTALTAVMSVRDVIMADRYIYLPLIGVFFLVLSAIKEKTDSSSMFKYLPLVMALIYAAISFARVDVFQDSTTLFTDVIAKESYSDKINPYLALPYNNRGIEYKRAKNYEQAQSDYAQAIACNPSYPSAYLNRGNIYFEQGNDDMAKADYDRTLGLERNAKAFSARGAIHAKQKRFKEAVSDLSEAISMDKYFVDAYSNRALTYLDMKQYDLAIADCDEILKISQPRHDMIELRGYVKMQKGDYQGAIADFDNALSLKPSAAPTYFNRANAHRSIGDKAAARRDANKAKSLGYQVPPEFMQSIR